MKDKKNFTKSEHYISRFIIEYFAKSGTLVKAVDIKQDYTTSFLKNSDSFMYQNNIFETRNIDGTFFERNLIENDFSAIEGDLSIEIPKIILHLEQGKILNEIQKKKIAYLVSFQFIRQPFFKNF